MADYMQGTAGTGWGFVFSIHKRELWKAGGNLGKV